MKKILTVGLMAVAIAGFTTITKAAPVKDMDLDISGLAQLSYQASDGTFNNGFDLAHLRLNFAAKPAEKVSVYAAIEGTKNSDGDSRVVDLYTDLTYLPWVTARIGQFATPNSYELNTNEFELETIDYTQAAGNFGMRDRGVVFFGTPIPEIGWSAWALNGNGAVTGAFSNDDDGSLFGAQLDWKALENLSFKLWGMMSPKSVVNDKFDGLGLGVNYKYAGFHLQAEYNAGTDTNTATTLKLDTTEYNVTGSYMIPETTLQLVGRYDVLKSESIVAGAVADNPDSKQGTIGLNWNFEKNARVQVMRKISSSSNSGLPKTNETDVLLSVKF